MQLLSLVAAAGRCQRARSVKGALINCAAYLCGCVSPAALSSLPLFSVCRLSPRALFWLLESTLGLFMVSLGYGFSRVWLI